MSWNIFKLRAGVRILKNLLLNGVEVINDQRELIEKLSEKIGNREEEIMSLDARINDLEDHITELHGQYTGIIAENNDRRARVEKKNLELIHASEQQAASIQRYAHEAYLTKKDREASQKYAINLERCNAELKNRYAELGKNYQNLEVIYHEKRDVADHRAAKLDRIQAIIEDKG